MTVRGLVLTSSHPPTQNTHRDWPLPCTGNSATDVIEVRAPTLTSPTPILPQIQSNTQVLHRYLDRPALHQPHSTAASTASSVNGDDDGDMPSAAMMPRLGGGSSGCAAASGHPTSVVNVNVSGIPLEQSVLRGLTPPRPARNGASDGGGGGEGEGGTKRPRVDGEGQEQERAVQQLLAQVPENDHRELDLFFFGGLCGCSPWGLDDGPPDRTTTTTTTTKP